MRKAITGLVCLASIVLLAACTSSGEVAANSSIPSSTARSTIASTASPQPTATYPTVVDTLPGGQVLPQGAQVVSVVRYQGGVVAAGDDFLQGGNPVLPICAVRGCNPVVWTASNGGQLTAVWGSIANGSISGEQLVVGVSNLLLFLSDEATRLWVTTDARTWTPVTLPDTMAALLVRKVVWGHRRFVAILSNKYAGGPVDTYGQSDTVWTSSGGTTWVQDPVPGPPAVFQSLNVDGTGFQIMGLLRASQAPAAWTSSDGARWTETG